VCCPTRWRNPPHWQGERRAARAGAVVSGRRRPVAGQLSLLPGCLDDRDRAVLAFARDHHLQGRVGAQVQGQLGISETRYFQVLLRLLDRLEVAEAEPELVAGLTALRRRRRRRLARPQPAAPGDLG